jgi:hypothetical protein
VQRLLKGLSGPPPNCCTALRFVIACTSQAASEKVFTGKYWSGFIGISLIRPPACLSLYLLQHHGVFHGMVLGANSSNERHSAPHLDLPTQNTFEIDWHLRERKPLLKTAPLQRSTI